MKKSGNGTFWKQYLYILGNFPFLWVVKIGISGDAIKRERQIDKTAKGWDFKIVYTRIWFAYQVEQFIHWMCDPIRVRNFGGSGHTERFYFPALLPALILMLIFKFLDWILIITIAFLLLMYIAGPPPEELLNRLFP